MSETTEPHDCSTLLQSLEYDGHANRLSAHYLKGEGRKCLRRSTISLTERLTWRASPLSSYPIFGLLFRHCRVRGAAVAARSEIDGRHPDEPVPHMGGDGAGRFRVPEMLVNVAHSQKFCPMPERRIRKWSHVAWNNSRAGSLDSSALGGVERKGTPGWNTPPPSGVLISGLSSPAGAVSFERPTLRSTTILALRCCQGPIDPSVDGLFDALWLKQRLMVFRQTKFTLIRVRSVGLGWYRWDRVPVLGNDYQASARRICLPQALPQVPPVPLVPPVPPASE